MSDTITGGTERPILTFEESASSTVLEVFGWETDNQGYIRDSSGSFVRATGGGVIHIDRFAGIVRDDGEPTPLRDDFVSKVDHVKSRSVGMDTGRSGGDGQ